MPEKTPSAATPSSTASPATAPELVEHFFRHEAGRLHGSLLRRLGAQHLSLVEDVVQEAMLRALRTWAMGGIPPNPSAWIGRVAHNLALDALRHRGMSAAKVSAIVTYLEQTASSSASPASAADDTEPHAINDDALRLLFLCCHPAVAHDAQVILALKVLGGFSTSEIARAFFGTEAAVEKQLTRTKQRLRDAGADFELPSGAELAARLDAALATLYLIFNEGYKASSGDQLLREDLSREAIRLAGLIVSHPVGDTPRAHALLALMLFNAARFPARLDARGEPLRLDDQDRSKWDHALIDRALRHLVVAAQGDELTEYHAQAGIAACHCLSPDPASTDWARILAHYDDLLRLKPSPIVALNRAVAIAHLHGPRAGLDAVAALADDAKLRDHYLVHAVTAELRWRLRDHAGAARSFRDALRLAEVGPEQLHLARLLERVEADA